MTYREYTIEELPQRSEAWYEARRGIVTASMIGGLITERRLTGNDYTCPKCEAAPGNPCWNVLKSATIKTPHPERSAYAKTQPTAVVIEPASNDTSRELTHLLVSERITGHVEPTFMNDAMYRGIIDEPHARDAYTKHYAGERFRGEVREIGFITEDRYGFTLGYSPDGLVGSDGLIEIKSRTPKNQVKTVLADVVPAEHMAQIQAGLLVTNRKWLDYVSFAGGMNLWVKRVLPDERWQKAIVEAGRRFEANAQEEHRLYLERVEGLPMTERVFELENPRVELEA